MDFATTLFRGVSYRNRWLLIYVVKRLYFKSYLPKERSTFVNTVVGLMDDRHFIPFELILIVEVKLYRVSEIGSISSRTICASLI